MAIEISKFLADLTGKVTGNIDPEVEKAITTALTDIATNDDTMRIETKPQTRKGPDISIIEVSNQNDPKVIRGAMITNKLNTPRIVGDWVKSDSLVALLAKVISINGKAVADKTVQEKKEKGKNKLMIKLASALIALGIAAGAITAIAAMNDRETEAESSTKDYVVELTEALDLEEDEFARIDNQIVDVFAGTTLIDALDAQVKQDTKYKGKKFETYQDFKVEQTKKVEEMRKLIESEELTQETAKKLYEEFISSDISFYTCHQAVLNHLAEQTQIAINQGKNVDFISIGG